MMSKQRGIDIAKGKLGLQEVRDKQVLMNFFKQESINGDLITDPSVNAWCAIFINACERAVGNSGTGEWLALSFKTYGAEVSKEDTKEGDIVVFHFPSDAPGHGHVTYFSKWDDANNVVECLGGNQNNMVKYSRYIQDYIVAIRRPPNS